MSATVLEPRIEEGRPKVSAVLASDLCRHMIVTNVGVVDEVVRSGVFVTALIRGTVWSLETGTGDVFVREVTWHESQLVSVDDI
jgi:hypothetical protein